MKKIIAIFVGLVMLVSSCTVFASDVDLSGKSVEELIALRDAVDDAIFAAGGKTIVEGGEYLVGRDIAAGTYVISVYSTVEENYPKGLASYTIWLTKDSKAKWGDADSDDHSPYCSIYYEYIAGAEGPVRATLEDGQVLELDALNEGTIITIEKSAGGLFMDGEAPMIAEE